MQLLFLQLRFLFLLTPDRVLMLKSLPLAGKNQLSSLHIRIAAVEECDARDDEQNFDC